MTTRHLRHVPAGAVVHQGDGTLDARVYQTVNMHVTVEDRAAILAEVGAALRPVLVELVARVEQLEAQNRALLDTLDSITTARPAPAELPYHHAPTAPPEVGTQPVEEPHLTLPPATAPPATPSWAQPSLLEELRAAR